MNIDWLLDGGYLPQFVIRAGIRRQLRSRLKEIASTSLQESYTRKMRYVSLLRTRPIAIETSTANTQHYEVGTGVLAGCLGPRMKYSCCLYSEEEDTLAEAEEAMLELYCDRAKLQDGQSILDLGCGWGSGCLYFAEKYRNSRVTGFSNSRTQKEYIDSKAREKGLTNLEVITGDVVDYEFQAETYDRVVSIELFEHMKNYERLMAKIASALKQGGLLFVHIFAHRDTPYDFESGWMTENFFTGGTMPSADLLLYFQRDLNLREQWWVNGKHYAKTCEVSDHGLANFEVMNGKADGLASQDWLAKMIANRDSIWPHLEETYGKDRTLMWWNRWQIFYMACAELFAYQGGEVWGVSHFLFEKPLKSEAINA